MAKKENYFAYILPQKDISGVVRTWVECETFIQGEKSARYKKFPTHLQAVEYILHILSPEKDIQELDKKTAILDKNALYFDSGTGRGVGVEISVKNGDGDNLLHFLEEEGFFEEELSTWGSYIFPKELGYTNNYGELFAFHCALHIARLKNIKTIYGDSKLIIEYWSLGHMNAPKLSKGTVELIKQVVLERKEFEASGGKIIFIEGKNNPADMGFHK